LGCWAAAISFIGLNTLCSFAACLGFCWWQTGQPFAHLWPFFASAALHGFLLCATAFLANCIASYAGSYLIVAGFYCMALANHSLYEMTIRQTTGIKKIALLASSYLIPDLSLTDIQSAVTYEQPITLSSWLIASCYILIFCGIQLSIALYLFERQEW
jgi:hypothetical protein